MQVEINGLNEDRAYRVLGIAGSLRKRSMNRRLLDAAVELAPEQLSIEPYDLADVPLYNGDLDTDELRPEAVHRLKRAIAEADGVLIATPEYNYSVPGVLKNALDWTSRPGGASPFLGKPVAIMGASGGISGTIRAQEHLKLICISMAALVMPPPGVVVTYGKQKFDADGKLTDEPTRQVLANFLRAFERWIAQVGSDVPAVV
jgi:chromate reductase, NAD(P)H dehydrogenase (quinone)